MNTKLLKLIIVINIILLLGQYLVTSIRATDGLAISDLNSRLNNLSQKNSDLTKQILELSSVSYIKQKALDLNLKPISVSYLTPLPVASAVNPSDAGPRP